MAPVSLQLLFAVGVNCAHTTPLVMSDAQHDQPLTVVGRFTTMVEAPAVPVQRKLPA